MKRGVLIAVLLAFLPCLSIAQSGMRMNPHPEEMKNSPPGRSPALLSSGQRVPADGPPVLLSNDSAERTQLASEWLRADDPRRIAWGAWVAAQDHQTALIPLLLERLHEYQPTGQALSAGDNRDAMLVVLDALIQLNVSVPVADARKLYPLFAAQSLILLAHSHEDPQSALMEIFKNSALLAEDANANSIWLAAADVLFEKKTPGFATLLLSRFTQHITLTVTGPDSFILLGDNDFVDWRSGCSGWLRHPRPDWPPVGLYFLTNGRYSFPWAEWVKRVSPNHSFLVGGRAPVEYVRAEFGYDNPFEGRGCCPGDRDEFRARYLNKYLEQHTQERVLNPYPAVEIAWAGEDDYTNKLLKAVEEQKTRFRKAIVLLRDSAGVLTAEESSKLQPKIEIIVRDWRREPSLPPLPMLTDLKSDPTITVRSSLSEPMY